MGPRRRLGHRTGLACIVLAGAVTIAPRVVAAPWVDVGDEQMRSDIEVLAGNGLINNVVTQWPLSWGGIIASLEKPQDFDTLPNYVRYAAERLQSEGEAAIATDRITYGVTSDFTNLPDVVRGFDALGREEIQGQAYGEWIGESTAIKLAIGAQRFGKYDKQTLVLDGSYIAQQVGGLVVYSGYVDHWWGPGWDTALSLSDNARPFPQIGWRRLASTPFRTPWLSWLGPWNHELFVGLLDGPRIARNTIFDGMRWSFNPLPGFEFAVARLQELCGTGHPCEPVEEFSNLQNGSAHVSKSKDEADVDLRYTNVFRGLTWALYTQFMNRDTGPLTHSYTSHLFGGSVWVPVRSTAVRFTAEYASTISTKDFFSFGNDVYGITYTDYKYTDGWQYRGSTLGSSLDADSRLASFHANWIGPMNVSYTLSYYRAWIDSPQTYQAYVGLVGPGIAPFSGNRVTAAPVTIDIGEAKASVPLNRLSLDVALRLQDDQPRPQHGFAPAGELRLNYKL